MRKNLLIDVGNSSAKIAVADPCNLIISATYTEPELSGTIITQILDKNPEIDTAIICSTRHRDHTAEEILTARLKSFIYLDHNTPIPIKNLYSTPRTLGPDRLAAAIGAAALAPGEQLLIIDLGSAITIDTVSANGEYLGGNISPGMSMRFNALHHMTEKLPLCGPPEKPVTTGGSTEQAIQSGVVMGILYEIEGYISRSGLPSESPKIFFTGRDAFYFADKLKKPIFANCDLVLSGLNRIIEYNASKTNI